MERIFSDTFFLAGFPESAFTRILIYSGVPDDQEVVGRHNGSYIYSVVRDHQIQ